MSFGVTNEGFLKKTIQDIQGELETDQRATISPSLNLSPSSLLGQLNSITADKIRELWDVLEAVYNAVDPDAASGAALEALSSLTGTFRLPATASTVTLSVELQAGTTLAVGRQVRDPNIGSIFATTEEVTNPGPGTQFLNVSAAAINTGPTGAPAGTLTEIVTPVSGWDSVTNPLDAEPGRALETDAELRIRREELLRVSGAGTLEAIRADVLALDGVTAAVVFENVTLAVDVNGLPGKSFEVVVQGGLATSGDNANPGIAEQIFLTKPTGIEAHGVDSYPVEDSAGNSHTIKFSRPRPMMVYFDVELDASIDDYPANGDDQVKAAIASYCDSLSIGDDLVVSRAQCAPFDVAGVTDVTSFEISLFASTTLSNNSENFNVVVGDDLVVIVDGGQAQTITLEVTDTFTSGAATAAELAAIFTAKITGASASDSSGQVLLQSDSAEQIAVLGGTIQTALDFALSFSETVPPGNLIIAPKEIAFCDTGLMNVVSTVA